MSENCKIVFLVGVSIVLGMISLAAVAQGRNSGTPATGAAYYQVFTDPMNATCRDPTRRKVKTSHGYKWRWVC